MHEVLFSVKRTKNDSTLIQNGKYFTLDKARHKVTLTQPNKSNS